MKMPPLGEGNSNPVNRGKLKVSPCYWCSSLLSSARVVFRQEAAMSARDVFAKFEELRERFEPAASYVSFDLKADSVDMQRLAHGIVVRMSYPVKNSDPTRQSGRHT